MGSDIYFYEVLSIDGKVIVIRFKSGQSCGLADYQETSRDAFWIGALVEHEKAYEFESNWNDPCKSSYIPNCPLTKAEVWNTIKPEEHGGIAITNLPKDYTFKDWKLLLKDYSTGVSSFGNGSGFFKLTNKSRHNIRKIFNSLNNKVIKNNKLKCFYKKPICISRYDYPNKYFNGFISDVKTLSIEYAPEYVVKQITNEINNFDKMFYEFLINSIKFFKQFKESAKIVVEYCSNKNKIPKIYNGSDYYDTKAIYQLTMTNEKWISHIKVGDKWDGR